MRLHVDNWRWADVPFYLRTGKRLPKRVSEIAIQFKTAPVMLFRELGRQRLDPNLLIVRIQPDEGISLRFGAKVPGPGLDIGTVKMDFNYVDYFGSTPSTGYETLLYDAMNGDQTLFHRADSVEAGWAVVTPILDAWASRSLRLPELRGHDVGPRRGRRADGARWADPGGGRRRGPPSHPARSANAPHRPR